MLNYQNVANNKQRKEKSTHTKSNKKNVEVKLVKSIIPNRIFFTMKDLSVGHFLLLLFSMLCVLFSLYLYTFLDNFSSNSITCRNT